jgi:hypothetical protein
MMQESSDLDYEIDEREIKAYDRLRIRHPNRLFYELRIGYTTAHAWGARLQRTDGCDDE